MITQETILKTRQWFHDNSLGCIEDVKTGKVKVNDPESYFSERLQHARLCLEGKYDNTLTFCQMAEFIQTGECKPLLP